MSKVVLAYSGGPDTTICVHYLRNIKGMKVYTLTVNLGQMEYLEPVVERAIELGAQAAHIADVRRDFVTEFVYPCLRARALYESNYYLFSAISRPLIVSELIKTAREEGCEYIAHGSRGIGNDSIRFHNLIEALDPDIKLISPLEDLRLETPQDDIEYAKKHNIKIEGLKRASYNVEQNLWGVNIQLRGRSQLWDSTKQDTYITTTPLSEAPNKPTTITLEYKQGVPVKLNGEHLEPVALVEQLTKIGGRNAVGRFSTIENRLSGTKTREIYESPAACLLYRALNELESVILDKDTLHFLPTVSQRYAMLVYEGKWFTPLKEAMDKFVHDIQRKVTGKVTLELLKGNITTTKIESPGSLI